MPASQHIILQQKLEIDFHEKMDANDLASSLSNWIKDILLPEMENVLNDLDILNCSIRIDAINIDAGTIKGENWQQILVNEVCKQLRQKIREAPIVPVPLAVDLGTSSISFYSTTERQKLILYYLKTGTLPWYAASLQATELLDWLRTFIAIGYFNTDASKSFFMEEPLAFHRFLLQTHPAALDDWFDQWKTIALVGWLPSVLIASRVWFGQNNNALVFTYALLFDALKPSNKPLWQQMIQTKFESGGAVLTLIKTTQQLFQHEINIATWKKTAIDQVLVKKEKPVNESENVTGEYFINNAGLVLLHPFLKLFFASIKLLDEKGNWKNDDSHQRGVLFANYICTSNTEMAEYDLPLCKLLTGYPFNQPINANLDATILEMEETQALLHDVISKWAILKTTSPEGLQNSFLKREGKLSRRDNGRLLQVEQTTYDLLIDHLPWSFSIIKNNWMDEILFTEWI